MTGIAPVPRTKLASRHRRLDGALADLPLDEPMLLTELDGFLTGIVVAPDPIPPGEWMELVWGSDDGDTAPFDDPVDVRWFADAVAAHRDEIARALDRGKPQPIFDINERRGEPLWDGWIDGFAAAMALRPDGWSALAAHDSPDIADAVARLSLLAAVARDESPLDSVEIDALHDTAAADIVAGVLRLHAARVRPGAPATARAARPGRNDACACGSGRKLKRCCG